MICGLNMGQVPSREGFGSTWKSEATGVRLEMGCLAPNLQQFISEKDVLNRPTHTIDGRNPAPPQMVETLEIIYN